MYFIEYLFIFMGYMDVVVMWRGVCFVNRIMGLVEVCRWIE